RGFRKTVWNTNPVTPRQNPPTTPSRVRENRRVQKTRTCISSPDRIPERVRGYFPTNKLAAASTARAVIAAAARNPLCLGIAESVEGLIEGFNGLLHLLGGDQVGVELPGQPDSAQDAAGNRAVPGFGLTRHLVDGPVLYGGA